MTGPSWTKDEVLKRLSADDGKASASRDSERDAYLAAAAVLVNFSPLELAPWHGWQEIEPLSGERVAQLLLRDCVILESGTGDGIENATGIRWMLRDRVRRDILQRLHDPQSYREALEANPQRQDTVMQRMLESYIQEDAKPLDKQTLEELSASARVVRWLEGAKLSGLPSDAAVGRQIEWQSLLAPFLHLTGKHFSGRADELSELRDYVGVLPPSTTSRRLWRNVRDLLGWDEQPPLFVFGPGGIGKSSLLAKFVLEHVEAGASQLIPFAYLDFDRPELSAGDPFTILEEIIRQLSLQDEQLEQSLVDASEQLHSEQRRLTFHNDEAFFNFESSEKVEDFGRILQDLAADIAEAYLKSQFAPRPLLLLFDTFEEVQYANESKTLLWTTLLALQSSLPKLRIVIAGRAEETSIPCTMMELGDLDPEASHGYLRALKVTSKAQANALVQKFGGNPLTLRLAVEILDREGSMSGLEQVKTRRALFWRVEQEIVQGVLYRRYLGHLHNAKVRELAHPGLVLRQYTPTIIAEVLNRPCGLKIDSAVEAKSLFDELARETAFVTRHGDGVLRCRADIRRIMLQQIIRDQPELVAKIHRAAIAFYKEQGDDVASRAEEIYHRLMMEQAASTIDPRWLEGIEPLLETALEEVPLNSRVYLAQRLDRSVSDVDAASSEYEVWLKYATKQAQKLIRAGQYRDALNALRERSDTLPADVAIDDNALATLEVEALIGLTVYEEAQTIASERLELSELQGNFERTRSWIHTLAHLELRLGLPKQAAERLASLRRLLVAEAAPMTERLRVDVSLLEALDAAQRRSDSLFVEVAQDVGETIGSISLKDLGRLGSLLSRAVKVLRAEAPDVLSKTLRALGLRSLDDKQRKSIQVGIKRLEDVTVKVMTEKTVARKIGKQINRAKTAIKGRNLQRISDSLAEIIETSEGIPAVTQLDLFKDVSQMLIEPDVTGDDPMRRQTS